MSRQESDSYRPRYGADPGAPPPVPADVESAMYHFQGNANQSAGRRDGRQHHAANRPPRPFKFRAPPPASARPLMTQGYVQESSEGLTFGENGAEDKFRNLDDLTDTDETDMDVSVDENQEQTNQGQDRPSKRTRINELGDAAEVSRWSNPDPYTALPPVDQDSRKKTNVVNLIRKARNLAASTKKDDSPHNDDFISFDFDEDDDEAQTSMVPPNAPSGPRLGRHEVLPSTLGKRTRDEFEAAPVVITKFGQQHYSDGRILDWWRADADCDSTPWLKYKIKPADAAGVALHKEIVDFYDWVRPKDYEVAVREDLLQRLEKALFRIRPGGKLHAFGSYAAGLYLPVGDMDLVYLERNFRPQATSNGLPTKPPRSLFHTVERFIRDQGLARPGSVNAIWFAKVPIIKFVDNVTGLKVDLSFNNNTGVIANETFRTWQEEYPAMPIITSVIKQFLMIRGLNDVAIGGLGGFSVICLVTSLIQHMPLTSQPANLGQLLVEFFNLYGKLFNRQTVAIRLDPPGYVDVNSYRPFAYNNDKPDRLRIIDPNRPDNNISGGTQKIGLIFDCFSSAHDILLAGMTRHDSDRPISSFLEYLIGGNFESYDIQRDFLRDLHYGPVGQQAPAVIPPPPPPITNRRSDEGVPPPTTLEHQARVPTRIRSIAPLDDARPFSKSSIKNQVNERGTLSKTKSFITSDTLANPHLPNLELTRAIERLVRLRPQLGERAEDAATMRDLASVGGYSNVHSMQQDLDTREGIGLPHSSPNTKPGKTDSLKTFAARKERARRFRSDVSLEIDQCQTKRQLAEICGYETSGELSQAITAFEQGKVPPEAKLTAMTTEPSRPLPKKGPKPKRKRKEKNKLKS